RHGQVQIVAFTPEQRVRLDVNRDVEVAALPAVAAHVSFAGHADARPVRQTRLDLNRQPLAAHFDLLACTGRAARLPLPARAAAMRARLREHHVAAGRFDDAGAMAMRAATLGGVQPARAVARPAMLLPGDGDRTLAAAHRVLEAERDRLMQIGAALWHARL